jgi:hypothetical protein
MTGHGACIFGCSRSVTQLAFPFGNSSELSNKSLNAVGAYADVGDGCAGFSGDTGEIGSGVGGKVFDLADCIDGGEPAGHFFINGFAEGEFFSGKRGVFQSLAVVLVSHADFDGGQTVEAVEVGDGEFVDAIDHGGMAEEDEIKPAATTGASRGGSKLAAHVVEHVTKVVVLGGERSGTDACGVGFGNSYDAVDGARWHAGTSEGSTGGGVGGCDKGIGAVVDVEEGSLGSFKEEGFSRFHGLVQGEGGIGEVRDKGFGGFEEEFAGFLEGNGGDSGGGEGDVVVGHACGQFFQKHGHVAEFGGANANAIDFIGVGRADAASGGADFAVTEACLPGQVHAPMVGEDEVGGFADQEVIGGNADALLAEFLHFREEPGRIHDHTIADHVEFVWPENPGRHQVEHVFGAALNDGVPGIVTALGAHDHIGITGEVVHDFSLAFITPLGTDDYGIGHD